ncbi:hypothetical protein pb186bvf_002428 [Paramecium bursaria]
MKAPAIRSLMMYQLVLLVEQDILLAVFVDINAPQVDVAGFHVEVVTELAQHCGVLELNPSNFTANYNKVIMQNKLLGLSYKQMEKYQEAIPFLDKENQLNSKHTSSLVTKFLCLQQLNRQQEALEVLEEINKINSKEEFHNQKIAFIYFDINEYDKAINCFQLQIKIKEYASDYRCLADISFISYYYQEVKKYLNKSLEIDPNLRIHIKKDF